MAKKQTKAEIIQDIEKIRGLRKGTFDTPFFRSGKRADLLKVRRYARKLGKKRFNR